MDYLEIKAPAKINVGLFVVNKRTDGFHDIETIFYPIDDLYDELIFSHSDEFCFTCSLKELENRDNLIVKAAEILKRNSGKEIKVRIELNKNIPMGAGMGGGSSDAAAALLSINEMLDLKFTPAELKNFALQLGSDVPFFLRPKPSFAESRGEELTLIDFDIDTPILIVNPGIHVSTAEAYRNIKPRKAPVDLRDTTQFNLNNPEAMVNCVKNDFEEYVFNSHPEVEAIKDTLYRCGAKFALMTGSGSTVFGIFRNPEDAQKAGQAVPQHYFKFIGNNW